MEDNFNELQLLLGAALDPSNSTKANLQADIDKIKGLRATIDDAQLSPAAIQSLNKQINDINLHLNLNIPTISTGNVGKQAQQAGQQIGRQIQHGVQNVIQKGDFKMNFDFNVTERNKVAKDAEKYFKDMANGVVTVHERMAQLDDTTKTVLNGFTVSIKNSSGVVEHLNYEITELVNDAGEIQKVFAYIGGSIDDAGVVKKFARIDKEYTRFSNKLTKFKETNSGIGINTSEFEKLLEQYKRGEVSLNELTQAYTKLETEATRVKNSLKSQNKSLDPVQQAFNNMRDIPNMLKALAASMNTVKDKTALAGISISSLSNEYEYLKEIMDMNDGKIPYGDAWLSQYKSLMSGISQAENIVNAQQKKEKSVSPEEKFKQEQSDRQVNALKELLKLRKQLVTVGEEEKKFIQEKIRLQGQEIADAYNKLSKANLYDDDVKQRYAEERDKNNLEYRQFEARQRDEEQKATNKDFAKWSDDYWTDFASEAGRIREEREKERARQAQEDERLRVQRAQDAKKEAESRALAEAIYEDRNGKRKQADEKRALEYLEKEKSRIQQALQRNSYGESKDAIARMHELNKGLVKFGDMSDIDGSMARMSKITDEIIAKLQKSHAENLKNINAEIAEEERKAKTKERNATKLLKEELKIRGKMSSVDSFGNNAYQNQINKIITDLQKYGLTAEQAEQETKELQVLLNSMFGMSGDQLVNTADVFAYKMSQARDNVRATKTAYDQMKVANKEFAGIFVADDTGRVFENVNNNYLSQINKKGAKFKSLGFNDEEISIKLQPLIDAYEKIKVLASQGTPNPTEVNNAVGVWKQALKEVENAYSNIKSDATSYYNLTKQSKLSNDIQNWLNKNTRASKHAKESLNAYYNELQNGRVSVARLTQIEQELRRIDAQQRGLHKLGYSLKDQLSQAATSFGQWMSVSTAMMTVVYRLKQMPRAVYDIDTAMTNLYKVTDETDAKYNSFLENAEKNAQRLGRSVSSLVEQSAAWAKLGYSIDESAILAQTSSVYANVGEVDDATAVSDLVTAMKSFGIEAKDSMTIVDKLNHLGNNFATDAKSLGEGLSHSASAMALGGMSLEKTLALLTGGSEITQSAGELGNALKIGQMRVMGMKGALEELGEAYDDIESVSKIQTQILNLTGGHVNIMQDEDPTAFRDYYDILEDVSEIYDKLDPTKAAELLETLFGKQRGNQGAAIIQAFQSGQIQKAYESALNADGSGMEEQERWLESLEAKTQQFEAAWQSLSATVLDSDLLKGIVDFGTGTLNVLDAIINKAGLIPTIAGVSGIGALIKNLDCPVIWDVKNCLDF